MRIASGGKAPRGSEACCAMKRLEWPGEREAAVSRSRGVFKLSEE